MNNCMDPQLLLSENEEVIKSDIEQYKLQMSNIRVIKT